MLLKTRFYLPPLRKQCVVRDELINKLKRSGGGELVLVSAPAGYGKTTIVSQWLHANPHTFCWLSIDASQSVAAVFWQHVIRALQNVIPGVGAQALHALQDATDTGLETAVVCLLNDLDELSTNNNSQEPITLVMDDFHRLHDPLILSLMNLFLDHLPPGIRLVLTCRGEPELSLAKRRANNQLHELGIADLAFNVEEGRLFFKQTMGLNLDDADMSALCKNSEGWVVGLQLAALALQKSTGARPLKIKKTLLDRNIEDYLFAEAFSMQEGVLQDFLILSCCPLRFSAGLCNALMNRQDSLSIISRLDQLNLFLVPLDNHRTWFRYHDLFRQFLLSRFLALPPAQVKACHQRCASWLEEAGYLAESLQQHIEAKNWPQAMRLLELLALENTAASDRENMKNWLQAIPASYRSPLLTAHPSQGKPSVESNSPSHHQLPAMAMEIVEPLTRREAQVMALVSKGISNKEIANTLNISLNTLKVHIRNLYGKMGVENRSQALFKLNQYNPLADANPASSR
ncbi:MAG: LuxR C-terminal-related transcriptional regulator [Bermanella sp.]